MKSILILLAFLIAVPSYAAEGFQPSHERNVVMLKSRTSGRSAFIFRDSSRGPLIVTQQHVIEGHESMILQWGHKVGAGKRQPAGSIGIIAGAHHESDTKNERESLPDGGLRTGFYSLSNENRGAAG
jgi:hypothetical protein